MVVAVYLAIPNVLFSSSPTLTESNDNQVIRETIITVSCCSSIYTDDSD